MNALDTLGIDWKVIIAQIINFGIILLILTKVLYKPILSALEARQHRIAESLKKADEIEKNAVMAEEKVNAKMNEAKKEAQKIMDGAKADGSKMMQELTTQAEKEADRIKKNAEAQMEVERKELYSDAQKRAGQLALLLMTKALKQDMGEEFYKKSLDKAIKEMETA
jgi:F-type H+-transporting ATPase subunit b